MSMPGRSLFLVADHGLAVVYFLQSDVASTLIDAGWQVVVLTDEAVADRVRDRFSRNGLRVESLRLRQARRYAEAVEPERQWWLGFLRRVGASRRINTEAMDSYIEQVGVEEPNRRRLWMPAAWALLFGLRRSAGLRRRLVLAQRRYTPRLYTDLLERYQPSLVVGSTPGWRLDRYLLRQAAAGGVRTAAVVIGWDNPSSYSLPGLPVDRISCWSEIQKGELVLGSDWRPDGVHVGGIPTYDGYFRRTWALPREEYFARHRLDPHRKLIAYACSFVSFAPNLPNVEALIRLIEDGRLSQACQLLVRLHPNHFLDVHLFRAEREAIQGLARRVPHVRVVEPVPLGGELGHYSGEDMPEKASMLTHADVFVTVYSTMVVEAALHDRPVVSLCLDSPQGWNTARKYSLPLSRIGGWPTHRRFREAQAGRVAMTEAPGAARHRGLPGRPAARTPSRGSGLSRARSLSPTGAPAAGRPKPCSAGRRPPEMRFLIVGLGSIGRRHFRNLLALGERDIVLVRSHQSTLPEAELEGFPVETDLERALARRPEAAVISTPTSLHLGSAIPAAEAGCHLLVEKPISHTLHDLDRLEQALARSGKECLVGYHFRFHPLLRRLKEMLEAQALGKIRFSQASWGEFLPAWHPWEDYRSSYAARRDQGGGVVRTLSHPIDYLLWLLGQVQTVRGAASNLGGLGIDADDWAEVTLEFAGGPLASIHLDYYRRPAAHWLELSGDLGTVRIDFTAGAMEATLDTMTRPERIDLPPGFDRNDLFLDEMRHFLEVCREQTGPVCGLAEARRSLEVALAVPGVLP